MNPATVKIAIKIAIAVLTVIVPYLDSEEKDA